MKPATDKFVQALARISAMFPTVEEHHIRDLYKK
jgi:hypothetical protein